MPNIMRCVVLAPLILNCLFYCGAAKSICGVMPSQFKGFFRGVQNRPLRYPDLAELQIGGTMIVDFDLMRLYGEIYYPNENWRMVPKEFYFDFKKGMFNFRLYLGETCQIFQLRDLARLSKQYHPSLLDAIKSKEGAKDYTYSSDYWLKIYPMKFGSTTVNASYSIGTCWMKKLRLETTHDGEVLGHLDFDISHNKIVEKIDKRRIRPFCAGPPKRISMEDLGFDTDKFMFGLLDQTIVKF